MLESLRGANKLAASCGSPGCTYVNNYLLRRFVMSFVFFFCLWKKAKTLYLINYLCFSTQVGASQTSLVIVASVKKILSIHLCSMIIIVLLLSNIEKNFSNLIHTVDIHHSPFRFFSFILFVTSNHQTTKQPILFFY